jgi:hypothetical protein
MPPGIQPISFKLQHDSLDIPSNHHTKAHKADFIVWSLKNNSGIRAFRIEINPKDSGLFATPPHQNGDIWTAEINHNVDSANCKYDIIYWKVGDSTAHKKDPIIAIRPSVALFDFDILLFIGGLILGALGFWGISKFRSRVNSRDSSSQ